MRRVTYMQQYRSLVDEALGEIGDLREAIEYDREEVGHAAVLVQKLAPELRAPRARLDGPSYRFEDADRPFKSLLVDINQVHRRGLDAHD